MWTCWHINFYVQLWEIVKLRELIRCDLHKTRQNYCMSQYMSQSVPNHSLQCFLFFLVPIVLLLHYKPSGNVSSSQTVPSLIICLWHSECFIRNMLQWNCQLFFKSVVCENIWKQFASVNDRLSLSLSLSFIIFWRVLHVISLFLVFYKLWGSFMYLFVHQMSFKDMMRYLYCKGSYVGSCCTLHLNIKQISFENEFGKLQYVRFGHLLHSCAKQIGSSISPDSLLLLTVFCLRH